MLFDLNYTSDEDGDDDLPEVGMSEGEVEAEDTHADHGNEHTTEGLHPPAPLEQGAESEAIKAAVAVGEESEIDKGATTGWATTSSRSAAMERPRMGVEERPRVGASHRDDAHP